jgi:hypothetical protein
MQRGISLLLANAGIVALIAYVPWPSAALTCYPALKLAERFHFSSPPRHSGLV